MFFSLDFIRTLTSPSKSARHKRFEADSIRLIVQSDDTTIFFSLMSHWRYQTPLVACPWARKQNSLLCLNGKLDKQITPRAKWQFSIVHIPTHTHCLLIYYYVPTCKNAIAAVVAVEGPGDVIYGTSSHTTLHIKQYTFGKPR